MTTENTKTANEARIRELIEKWAKTTRDGDSDEVLSNHSSDVLIFDVLSPLQYKGADAYRKSWDDWHPSFESESLFEIHDLNITSGKTVAFCHCLIQCGGTLPNGGKKRGLGACDFLLTQNGWQVDGQASAYLNADKREGYACVRWRKRDFPCSQD